MEMDQQPAKWAKGRVVLTVAHLCQDSTCDDEAHLKAMCNRCHLRYDVIPTVLFTHPPIGTVGMSEEQAREHYPNEPIKIYKTEFVSMFYALTEVKPQTAMKLVCVGADERVVGCHVIGLGADEMIQGFAVAVSMGARKRDFDDTIAIHPTSAEELVTMR